MIPTKPTLKSAQSNWAFTESEPPALATVPPSSPRAKQGDLPILVPIPELTPKAQAKASNKLPPAEQMTNFEEHLEEKDSGNRPA